MATKIYTYQHQLGSAIISVASNGKAMYQGRMYASRQSAYKGKGYNITGDFHIDNDGYLHHWHDDDGEEFEIKYLLHED